MPIEISRPVTVYRLFDNTDLRDCFTVLAESGWLCSLVAEPGVVWSVRLQHNKNRAQVSADPDGVLVWDGVTPLAQTVADFNTANPGNRITKGK